MRYSTVALSIAACLSLSLACVPALALTPSSADSQKSKTQKALLIGVDGMQYEKLQEAIAQNMAPHIGSLKLAKSYIGGIDGTSTEQLTNSGPGWATILTGSWVNRHQVDANNGALRNQAPSLFEQLKRAAPQRKTTNIVSWGTINDNFAEDIAQGYIDSATKCLDVDQCVADKAGYELEHGESDLVFAHFDEPDLAGHDHGFATEYQQAIQGVDAQVGQLLSALERRQATHPKEDWLIIVSPDHGRRLPDGYSHGQQTLSEKTTFIAMNKSANAQLTDPVSAPTNPGHSGLYGFASQADITPTILKHFGVTPEAAQHSMDGLPLIGALGVRQLTAQALPATSQVVLTWQGDKPRGKPVHIYRDGQHIASVPNHQGEYIDNDVKAINGNVNYTVEINKVPVSRLVTLQH